MKHWIKITIAAVLSILLAGVFIVDSFKLTANSAMVPRILAGLIIVLALLSVIESYYRNKHHLANKVRVDQPHEDELIELEQLQGSESPIRIKCAIVFVLFVGIYIFLLDKVGYFIMTPAFVIVSYLFLKSLSWWKASAIAIVFTLFIYAVFVVFLKIPIPMGIMR